MKTVHSLSKITLAVGLSLALAFTLSCSSDSSGGGGEENNSSSSEGGINLLSSSSIVGDVNSSSSTVDLSSSSETEQSSSSIIGDTSSSSSTVDLSSSSENTTELSSSSIVSEISSSSSVVSLSSSSEVETGISSSSEAEAVGGGLSGLHTQPAQQVYLNNGENGEAAFYENIDVMLVFKKYEWDGNNDNLIYRDEFPAGKIENGKLTLDLPESIDSKYFEPVGDICEDLENTMGAIGKLYVDIIPIPEIKCHLIPMNTYYENGVDYFEAAEIFYLQEAGRIKCDKIFSSGNHTDDDTIDLNFSKGWNTWYSHSEEENYYYKSTLSTDPNIIKGELKWTINCN